MSPLYLPTHTEENEKFSKALLFVKGGGGGAVSTKVVGCPSLETAGLSLIYFFPHCLESPNQFSGGNYYYQVPQFLFSPQLLLLEFYLILEKLISSPNKERG